MPAFSEQYAVTATHSAWLLTLPFLALAAGPILVGAVLQRANARVLLSASMGILGISLLGFSVADSFATILAFRVIQSLVLAVIFTACITYASRVADPTQRQRRVALYVSTSILGGFTGRLLSGFLADEYGLQVPFAFFGVLALVSAVCVSTMVKDIALQGQRLRLRDSLSVLKGKNIRTGLIIVFTTFFTFSGALTTIPFRLVDLDPNVNSSDIALVYSGYAIGIFIPVSIAWLVNRGMSEIGMLRIGATILLVGLCGMLIPNTTVLLFVFLLLAAGMFSIHATAAGLLNRLQPEHASIINGAYISNYYSAAAIASVVPLWIIQFVGWNTYVGITIVMVLSAFWHISALDKNKEH
jgi:YNFM family putative membrane transporter